MRESEIIFYFCNKCIFLKKGVIPQRLICHVYHVYWGVWNIMLSLVDYNS